MSRGRTDPPTGIAAEATTVVDFENLNGSQIALLRETIDRTFSEPDFARMLREKLDLDLQDFAALSATFPQKISNVIEASQQRGFGQRLIQAIEAERPDAPRVEHLREELRRQAGEGFAAGGVATGSGRRVQAWRKLLVSIAVVAVLGAGAWFAYHKTTDAPDLDPLQAQFTVTQSEESFHKAVESGTLDEWRMFLSKYKPYSKYLDAELFEFAERMLDECGNVNLHSGTTPGPEAARWCSSKAATQKASTQAYAGNCAKYWDKFGPYTQNALADLAIFEAKAGKNANATEAIEACQCANPETQRIISQSPENMRMICWLRTQPLPPPPKGSSQFNDTPPDVWTVLGAPGQRIIIKRPHW